jgi:hypothetical protein
MSDKNSSNGSNVPVVYREWSPYGSPAPDVPTPIGYAFPDDDKNQALVFREWQSKSINNEVDELVEQESNRIRRHLHELREHGRLVRLHRLQALDALETRRITLTEILRRMEKELNDTDVYEYGDVLAEVFGERKIYAHRAVGLEALLCQYMHQMLAKQHQLKIMKRAGKDIEGHYRKSSRNIKDNYHSYEALCFQLEASRLSLEDIYDDIFASQHRMLAQLKHVESGGDMTNYSIPSPEQAKSRREPTMKGFPRNPDFAANEGNTLGLCASGDISVTDEIKDVLSSPQSADGIITDNDTIEEHLIKTVAETAASLLANPLLRTDTNTSVVRPKNTLTVDRPTTSRRSPEDGMTSRERRREIEKQRMARPSRISTSNDDCYGSTYFEEDDVQRARSRLRELEAKAAGHKSWNDDDDGGTRKNRTSDSAIGTGRM